MMRRIELLGPIRVVGDEGAVISIGGARQQRLLVALVMAGPNGVTHDVLAERVWDDDDRPADPPASLRSYVARLRAALEPGVAGGDAQVVRGIAGGYAFARGEASVDLDELDALRAEVDRTLDPRERIGPLEAAVALFRGRAFGDAGDLPWLVADRERLAERRLDTIDLLLDARLELGQFADVIAEARRELAAHPFREHLRHCEMLALYRCGRQADALAAYQQHRARLIDELGVEASPELRNLERLILDQDASLDRVGRVGRPVRGYQLGDAIGTGAFSIVYRATQPSVGREVALKVIRAELANRPDFVRRFDVEARTIARLEHPHIVPLYDYWREPDSAYLAMRLLPGGSLANRLLRGAVRLDEAARIVDQVAAALSVAHQAGVVHRDVKPANILLDADGNAFLGDFGIAAGGDHLDEPGARISAGSPAYAAPEQLRGLDVDPTADVYSLGITIFEMLTAQLPWPDARDQASLLRRQLEEPLPPVGTIRGGMPPAIEEVIERATRKNPAERTPSVTEVAEAFQRACSDGETDPSLARAGWSRQGAATFTGVRRNPYVGLRAFDEGDADRFFGREALVDRMLDHLRRPAPEGRILAVVGASGSGKSSAVRAGLLPALRRDRLPGSGDWFVTVMTPGDDPFGRLREALSAISTTPVDLDRTLLVDRRGIARAVATVAPPGGRICLVVDQLEELFTGVEASVADRFLDSLADAVVDVSVPLTVIVTLRADFTDRPLRHQSFAPAFQAALFTVGPLGPAELEHAVVDPAVGAGGAVEPALVAQIAAELAHQPAALPLLQYTLTELFELGDGHLTLDGYRELDGLTGAMVQRAEAVVGDLDEGEVEELRIMTARLVGADAGGRFVRRRARRVELGAPGSAGDAIVDRLGAARLLSFDHVPDTREPTAEWSHEALLTAWPRLAGWLEADRATVEQARQIASAADDWEREDRDPGGLLRGTRLEVAEALVAASPTRLTDAEQDFVTASVDERQREADARTAGRRRLRRVLVATAILAVAAVVAGVLAVALRREADDQRDVAQQREVEAAEQREAAAQSADEAEQARTETAAALDEAALADLRAAAIAAAETDPELALLLAAEAYERDPGAESQQTLVVALTAAGGRSRAITGGEHVIEPLPECLAHASSSGFPFVSSSFAPTAQLAIVDPAAGTSERAESILSCPALSPDGTRFAATVGSFFDGGGSGPIVVVEIASGETLAEFPPDLAGAVWVDPDTILLWRTDELPTDGPSAGVPRPAFYGDVVSGEVTSAPSWDFAAVSFSPDGTTVVGARRTGPEDPVTGAPSVDHVLADAATGGEKANFGWTPTASIAWTLDGSRLAIRGHDAPLIRIVDPASGAVTAELATDGSVCCPPLAWSPDGSVLVEATRSPIVRLHTPDDPESAPTEIDAGEEPVALSVLDANTVAALHGDGTVVVVGGAGSGLIDHSVTCCAVDETVIGVSEAGVARTLWVEPGTSNARLRYLDVETGAELSPQDPPGSALGIGGVLGDGGEPGAILLARADGTVERWEGTELAASTRAFDGRPPGKHAWARFQPDRADPGVVHVAVDIGPAGSAGVERVELLDLDVETMEVLGRVSFDPPLTPDGGFPIEIYPGTDEWLVDYGTIPDEGGPVTAAIAFLGYDGTMSVPVERPFGSVHALPTGDLIVGSFGGDVEIIGRDGTARAALTASGLVIAANSPVDTHFALVDERGNLRLYDAADGAELAVLATEADVDRPFVQFSADGAQLWSFVGDSLTRFAITPEAWFERACGLAGRSLAAREWDAYLPGQPYRDVCAR